MELSKAASLVAIAVGVGCAPDPASTSDEQNRQLAALRAQQAAADRAAFEQQQAALRASGTLAPTSASDYAQAEAQARAQQAALEKITNDARAQAAAQDAARREAAQQECTSTRGTRAADAQEQARGWLDFDKRVLAHRKTIATVCQLTLTNTGNVNLDRTRAYQEKQEGISCRGALPKGVSKQDAWYVLHQMQPGAPDDSGVSIDSESEFHGLNRRCEDADRAAGLNIVVGRGDAAGLNRLLGWSAVTP